MAKFRTVSFMHRPKWSDLFYLFLITSILSCAPEDKARTAIHEAIEIHGGDLYDKSEISFRFRDRDYSALNDGGVYQYVRVFEDSTGLVRDVLNNDGFYREINGQQVDVIDTMAAKYARSVNSVIYFAMLPDALDDAAVVPEYMGTKEIKGTTYDKIRVTFRQEGGGKDYEDVFIYWFDTETRDMDYLAYLYYTDEGGIRFREAYNPRVVNGMKFYDFINYQPKDTLILDAIDEAYLNGELEELSRIELEDIQVKPL